MTIDELLNTSTYAKAITEPLTADALLDVIAKVDDSPPACGYVIRAALERSFRAQFEAVVSPEDVLGFPRPLYGLDVYFDHRQEEDCVIFYDRALMIAYLNRWEEPKKYMEEFCRVNGITLDELRKRLAGGIVSPR